MNLDISNMSNLGWNPKENSQASIKKAALELFSESI